MTRNGLREWAKGLHKWTHDALQTGEPKGHISIDAVLAEQLAEAIFAVLADMESYEREFTRMRKLLNDRTRAPWEEPASEQ